jgi:hypothetical protein
VHGGVRVRGVAADRNSDFAQTKGIDHVELTRAKMGLEGRQGRWFTHGGYLAGAVTTEHEREGVVRLPPDLLDAMRGGQHWIYGSALGLYFKVAFHKHPVTEAWSRRGDPRKHRPLV